MTEKLEGTIRSIVFRNDETGYTVCSVHPADSLEFSDHLVTVVGKCAAIWVGEELTATGEWILSPQFGKQFKASEILCIAPTSTEGIFRYLSSGMIRGIGKVYAKRIVDAFGEKTLEILDKSPERLNEVKGLGKKKQQQVKQSWTEQGSLRESMIFLQSHGIGSAMAAKIFRKYGADAIAVVKKNPYHLAEEVRGIGFKTADAIALNIGIQKDSEIRAQAGLIYCLRKAAEEEGHCYMPESELLLRGNDILGISIEKLSDAILDDEKRGILKRDGNRIYLADIFDNEQRTARKLLRILDTPASFNPIPPEKAVPWAEKKMGLTLATAQLDALYRSINAKVAIITGGPGVGKTTIIKALCEIFSARKLRFFLAAPTGRAAKRMTESTGKEAATIHRLLKYQPATNDFFYNAGNTINGDCFIIDEASMFDIALMRQFVEALPDSATLIIVGDTDQLPSVGPGNVLADLIASGKFPCSKLTAIFRQSQTGYIVRNAHRINRGEHFELPPPNVETSDFYFLETDNPNAVIQKMLKLLLHRIPDCFHLDPLYDVQILSPMRRGILGTENLNAAIQHEINPTGRFLNRGDTKFREKDRVMQISNNYDKDVFNGDVGIIERVDEEARQLAVLFDGRPVIYDQNELDELILAYACSIHKSQGSEYPAIIVLVHTQHFKLLQRNLLYTAITRGKKLVCVIGSSKAIKIALNTNNVVERKTSLRERLNITK